MKIANVDIFTVGEPAKAGGASWAGISIVLRLTTSDGVVGYGEAVPTLRVRPVVESLKEVGRLYKGKDPSDLELNQHEWHKHDFYLPVSFESTTALSAFDIACWDIIGKHHGVPIHKLLGGASRNSIRMYSNGWYAGCVTPEQFAARAKKYAGMGYTGLKFDPFGRYYDWIDGEGLELAYGRVKAVKDATKGRVDLMIEHHGRFNPNSAIMAARKLEPLEPLFMEEPIHPDNVEGLRKYRASTRARVALGERILTKEHAAYVCSNHLADFLQADITNIGGVTQARKVSAIAEAYGVEMAFHNAFGPIQNAATLQVDATIPNFLIQESFYDVFPGWKRKLVKGGTEVVRGHSKVPTRPGLGVEVDESILEEYSFEGQEAFDPEEPVWVVKDTWKNS
ncbi:MAG: mandelate racemase/muconate lactonizing enzyme family protein [Nitrososphaerota archaeon]|nr:mandelate racemase/muconate lactonizing enzyme family protein [Nitrososphaerota archaeon]MDG7024109.1 mandelate racemase/muconate lactonizing enzyme family protein [Nitrososphaerota archaeon]